MIKPDDPGKRRGPGFHILKTNTPFPYLIQGEPRDLKG
jgi:hypothetical protein